jgi:chaperone required for assembly of F1-ATPase
MTAADPSSRLKRFYAKVALAPIEGAPAEGGFAVTLDGRTPRSPEGRRLALPTHDLADLVAAEWESQGAEIAPATMPATRLAWTAIALADDDKLQAQAAALMGSFAGSDLLCYFAEWPRPLAARQEAEWAPMIAWAETALGVSFRRTAGVIHQAQPEATVARIAALAAEEEPFVLAALVAAAPLFGSAILALALRHGQLTGEDAFARSRLDESFQEESWGADPQETARAAAMAEDARLLERWFAALAPSDNARRLARLGGTDPHAKAPPRRRF